MDPSTARNSTPSDKLARLHTDSKRSLVDLPGEIIEAIASHLNSESSIALISTNHHFHWILRNWLEFVRLRRIPEYALAYLRVEGASIKRLDLSGCRASWDNIQAAIRHCQHITELNVINSDFRSLEALDALRELEALGMSALLLTKHPLPKNREPFKSIKKLHLDIGPRIEAFRFAVALMNLCEIIEAVYVNVYGSQGLPERNSFPVLTASRWKTLHTFVCTQHLSDGRYFESFLRCVFAFNWSPRIAEWISQCRDCYIYEHGYFNGDFSDEIIVNENLRLLSEYHDTELTDRNTTNIFQSPWGVARSIRFRCHDVLVTEVACCPSTTLTEMDLTRCHSQFSQKFRLSLIAATPSLEFMACSLCFFLPAEGGDDCSKQRIFGEALRKLKLKTFSVKGVSHIGNCASSCVCGHEGWPRCSRCNSGEPLTSENMVDIKGFVHLKNLMLSGVTVRDSAYGKMAGSKLRCVKIRLNAHNEFWGLQGFIQRSRNLEFLKLEAFDLPVRSLDLWKALDEGKNLTQLCLRSGTYGLEIPELGKEFLDCFERILQRVDVVHLHSSDREFREALENGREEAFRQLEITNYYGYHLFSSRDVRYSTIDLSFGGRALCLSDYAAGLLPPRGWDVE